jgi:hypothetical protein
MNLYGYSGPHFPIADRFEDDEELRKRLLYVGGDGAAATQRIHMARGKQLDDLAESMNLKRRKL